MDCDFNYLYHAYKYGVQGAAGILNCHPSSVSRAVQDAETALGYPLFNRRTGGKLEPLAIMHEFYLAAVAPAVEGLARFKALGRTAKNGAILNIGATEFMVREHLSPIIAQLQREYPTLRIQLHLGNRDMIDDWLEEKTIDVAILATDEPPRKWPWQEFIQVTPVLVTLASSPIAGFEALVAQKPIVQRLVCPPACEGVCRMFGRLLNRRDRRWDATTIAGSTALVSWMVSAPDMVGLSVAVTALERKGVIRHPLPLPPLLVGAMWRGQPTALLKGVMALIAKTAPQYQTMMQKRPTGGTVPGIAEIRPLEAWTTGRRKTPCPITVGATATLNAAR